MQEPHTLQNIREAERDGRSLKAAREERGLTTADAIAALGVSRLEYMKMECGPLDRISMNKAINKLSVYLTLHKEKNFSGNLLFGLFPLRFAREILGLSIQEIAAQQKSAVSTWQSYELNKRRLDKQRLLALEKEVKLVLRGACFHEEDIRIPAERRPQLVLVR